MKHLNKIISAIILATPFIGNSCGENENQPQSVYGPSLSCNVATDCVEIGKAWLDNRATEWVCNIEDGASDGMCGLPKDSAKN